MKSINIFLSACLTYKTIKLFNIYIEEMILQVTRGNFTSITSTTMVGVLILLFGCISVNYLYKELKTKGDNNGNN